MKICAIGLRGIPDVMGGIESHCQQLYPRMVEEGDSLVVIARSPYVSGNKYTYKGVDVVSVWTLKHKFLETFMHTFFAILYARVFVHPDVVHLHAIGPALFTPLARLLGMKVVVTHHGADYDRQKWNGLAKFILKSGEKMGVLFSNKMFVVGKTLTNRLKKQFPKQAEKIHYVPNGMLPSFTGEISASALPKELPISSQGYILTVGRLVPEKGFHDLVTAYKASNSHLKLVIVGQADHQDEYASTLVKQASDSIIFAGRRSGDELKALYKHAKVFVLPSYHEGLPIVALEAISAGTPVVLSDILPNRDIEAPKDSYFKVGVTSALADKLTNLDSLDLELDQNTFLCIFNWDRIAENTLSLIKSVFTKGDSR
ncbi:glycosyl transferase [Alteromonas mediterranea]|uniref:glycosyltransferase family 4 protein n=1 Tax=Alteromonas mediterranea TaxID=314275 RepID=UPI0009033568|nr:glycosyltransferase family 4 protein [Alteromonas mediterranea]APD93794.1 glycosyl transferase [Alteromonas mediterranea]APD97419.1 glycosyl transferase [Alteromonas mediterranea]